MEYTILDYIPQRPPFVMVDKILTCTENFCKTQFEVRADNPLIDNGILLESGVVENIAQTCAAFIGYVNIHLKKQAVRIGVIGAVKDFTVEYRPNEGDTLTTEVKEVGDFGDMKILHAKTLCNDREIASCEMKVALIG